MITLRHFTLRLTLQGPILTKATSPSNFGLSAAVARDFPTGRPILPGSLIKGKVREALYRLGERDLDPYFGQESEDPALRGSFFFGDLATEHPEHPSHLHRIAEDSEFGSARSEMLRRLEAPFPPGERVDFEGRLSRYCTETEAEDTRRLLHMGLAFLTQAGSGGGTGMGRLLDAMVTLEPEPQPNMPVGVESLRADLVALDLALEPQGPLCFAQHQVDGNLFVSGDVIPGGALAGAVMSTAEALGIANSLRTYIDRIRFRHAFPCKACQKTRPQTLPLSTVKAKGSLWDVSSLRTPHLIGGEAPTFRVDWKESDEALALLGLATPARELRVRTAMDAERRRADQGNGEGGKLFAQELVHPVAAEDRDCPIVWRTRVDLQCLPSNHRLEAARILNQVFSQLGFLGKTKAFCKVEATAVVPQPDLPPLGEELTLVLQSPALLADPRFQAISGVPRHGVLSGEQQQALYRAAWDKLSDGSLELSHAFAQQTLAGGTFLMDRFLQKMPYNPWLLTSEGSVFVFRVKDPEKARPLVQQWLATGLDLPTWAKEHHGETWKQNPYIPWNGYGEVALHEPPFERPPDKDLTPVVLAACSGSCT